jgi:two-component system, chemotaxis family, chemotaxis protein CheY
MKLTNCSTGAFMKTLIVDDDFTNRTVLQGLLKAHGEAHVAMNGAEACEAVRLALEANDPYNLICLDMLMPEMNGSEALKVIRGLEKAYGIHLGRGAKIVMITGVDDPKKVMNSFSDNCDAYLIKPVSKDTLERELEQLGLA